MISKWLHGVQALAFASALVLAGCGGDDEPTDAGTTETDAGFTSDVGTDPVDTGVNTRPDTGTTPDTGTGSDAGSMVDTGTRPDTGVTIPPGEEGRSCAPGNMPCDTGLDCLNLSPMDVPPAEQVLVCLKQCMNDIDCAGSDLEPPASLCSPLGVCVQQLEPEGGVADLFREEEEQVLKGCEPGLTPYDVFMFDLEPDSEFACVRQCSSDDDCTTAGIETCNTNRGILGPGFPGMCTRSLNRAGAPCSLRDATRNCTLDFQSNGLVICVDIYGRAFNQGDNAGICTQYCGDLDGNVTTPPDVCRPQRPGEPVPTCETGLFQASPDLGLCNENCSAFPNDCTTPEPSACFPFGNLSMPILSNCLETETSTTGVISVYDLRGLFSNPQVPPTAAQNCAGRENECPNDAFCVPFQVDPMTGATTIGACLYGCDPTASAAQSGCGDKTVAGTAATSCETLGTNDPFGFCSAPIQ